MKQRASDKRLPLPYRLSTFCVLAVLALFAVGMLFCEYWARRRFSVWHRSNLLLVFALVGCSSLMAAWLWGRWRFLMPLEQLLAEIRDLRHGRRSEPFVTRRHDVIGQLTREYNRLYHALHDSRLDLDRVNLRQEQNLDERTRRYRTNMRRLERAACTDDLSGLANRPYFFEQLSCLFEQAKAGPDDLACLIIDIDNFKTVNDRLGHPVGDAVIAFAGQLLRASIRPDDVAARYGGDEFVLLLAHCSEKHARAIAERIRLLFAREADRVIASRIGGQADDDNSALAVSESLRCRLSIGIATVHLHAPRSAQHLIELADQALYQVKQNGRNAVALCPA
ncbi:MAG: diguanylate cyclase [Sedimentisphaerales bacterium]|nr:diguanylate cyclase [Sedimentisphaerales bacterium]